MFQWSFLDIGPSQIRPVTKMWAIFKMGAKLTKNWIFHPVYMVYMNRFQSLIAHMKAKWISYTAQTI